MWLRGMVGWWHFGDASRLDGGCNPTSWATSCFVRLGAEILDCWKQGKQFCHAYRNMILVEMPPSSFPTGISERERIGKRALRDLFWYAQLCLSPVSNNGCTLNAFVFFEHGGWKQVDFPSWIWLPSYFRRVMGFLNGQGSAHCDAC